MKKAQETVIRAVMKTKFYTFASRKSKFEKRIYIWLTLEK